MSEGRRGEGQTEERIQVGWKKGGMVWWMDGMEQERGRAAAASTEEERLTEDGNRREWRGPSVHGCPKLAIAIALAHHFHFPGVGPSRAGRQAGRQVGSVSLSDRLASRYEQMNESDT